MIILYCKFLNEYIFYLVYIISNNNKYIPKDFTVLCEMSSSVNMVLAELYYYILHILLTGCKYNNLCFIHFKYCTFK